MDLTSLFSMDPHNITREFYWNVGGPHGFMRWGIYIFMFAAFFYLGYTIVKKVRIWRKGKAELRTDYPEKRIMAVIRYVFLQAKILKEGYAGIMHAAIFFGFVVLAIVTAIIVVQEDITGLFFNYHFIHGNFYLIWSLFGDIFGVVVLFGLGMAIFRRYISKPTRLDTKKTDTFALALITLIIITGFTNEAMRIAATGMLSFEKLASPFGYVLALGFDALFSNATLRSMHYINWWVHMLAAFSFIGLVASDKLGHIIVSSLNVYFMNLDNLKEETKYAMPIIDPAEF
jgi:nitrate reductase gamma subunit